MTDVRDADVANSRVPLDIPATEHYERAVNSLAEFNEVMQERDLSSSEWLMVAQTDALISIAKSLCDIADNDSGEGWKDREGETHYGITHERSDEQNPTRGGRT